MPKLTNAATGQSAEVPPGTPLLDALTAAGSEIRAECGGKGTCGGCLVVVESGEVAGDFADFLSGEAVRAGFALACRAVIAASDVTVRPAAAAGASPATDGASGRFEKTKARRIVPASELTPLVAVHELAVPLPRPMDGLSDLDRLTRTLARQTGAAKAHCPLGVLRRLPGELRRKDGKVFAAACRDGDDLRIVDVSAAPPAPLGLAVDLGTTSIAVEIVDLASGQALTHAAAYNAQIARGADVISRINYAARPGGLTELRQLALDTINALALSCLTPLDAAPERVMAVSVSGNTVMTHLLLGIDPEHIRLDPYTPAVMRPPRLVAGQTGLAANEYAPVLFAPAVGSYVGGDITSGLLLTALDRGQRPRLFIDIGTNGEAVLGGPDYLLGLACSAGPAFEGGGLSCGMRAQNGAVEAAGIDPVSGDPRLTVIGGEKPRGVCGSGVIDLIAALFAAKFLDAAGRLDLDRGRPRIRKSGRRAEYVLAFAAESATGGDLTLTEADIENVIRAKAAIYSGCAVLLDQAGLDFGDLAEVIVAGGFGRHLHIEESIAIGLLPDIPRERFSFIGNASLAGTALALVSEEARARREDLAGRLTYLDLSLDPSFMHAYTAALFLPHTEAGRFPSQSKP